MSISFKTHFVKDVAGLFSSIKSIANEYQQGIIDRHLLLYSKIRGRIVCALQHDELVGYYIYIPAEKFLFDAKWLSLKQILRIHNIDLSKATVPCFAFVTRSSACEDLYIQMLQERVRDSKQQGYMYGIVGINQIQDSSSSICKQRAWIEEIDMLANLTATTYFTLEYKHEAGENILIHRY